MKSHYSLLGEHQKRIIANTLASYFSDNFTGLGHFEYGNFCYASAQAAVHMQSWNFGITIDVHEFQSGERNKILSRVEKIVSEGKKIGESDAEELNFIKIKDPVTSQ